MNGFLVLARCAFSDRPLALCATREEAAALARRLLYDDGSDPYPHPLKPGALGPPRLTDRLLGVGVVPFAGGTPGEFEPVTSVYEEGGRR